ncbi:MAG: hypothetical protein K9G58_10435 [Bacteroidales bacterium]|nr:hypothetical protein [Bacteroidales bacterium]
MTYYFFLTWAMFGLLNIWPVQGQISIPLKTDDSSIGPEKIYLHTDRDVYVAGENIYFSADCFVPGMPEWNISNIIYAELFDNKQNSLARKKLKVEKGMAHNRIRIPADLPTDYYYLRVFTQFSRNFPPSVAPYKAILVINPEIPPELNEQNTIDKVEFYTENSGLVNDIRNRLVFRMNRQLTKTTDSVFLFRYGTDTTRVKVTCLNDFGIIDMIPTDSVNFELLFCIKNQDSLLIRPEIPLIKPEIFTKIIKEHKRFRYILSANKFQNKILLLQVMDQALMPLASRSVKLNNDTVSFDIAENDLNDGINYFILKHGDSILRINAVFRTPIVEEVTVKCERESYQTREKVTLQLKIPHDTACLSVSVVKMGSRGNTGGLNAQKLLNPDLLLHDPLSSLNITNEDLLKREAALLILNKKLREDPSFLPLKEASNDKFWIPETRDIGLSGYVVNQSNGQPVAEQSIIGSVLFSRPQFHINSTQQDGSFFLSFYGLYEMQNLFLSPMHPDGDLQILINNDFGASFPAIEHIDYLPDSSRKSWLNELYLNAQLTDKYGKADSVLRTHALPDVFKDKAHEISLSEYIELSSMKEVFKEIVPFARMRKVDGETRLGVLNHNKNIWYENPLILLDNIPISNAGMLDAIHPSTVENISVINETYVLGDHFIPGIIFINTLKGKFAGLEMPDNSVFLEYQMLAEEQKFEVPDYEYPGQVNNPRPDFRNCLYWAPGITVHQDTVLEFYTSDHISKYEIFIEGVDYQGNPIAGYHIIEVSSK